MVYQTPVAQVYDLFFPKDRSAEADLWARLAGPSATHLLEPMAGTCEIAALLARRGYCVTGVEPSHAMVERAKERLAAEGEPVANRLSLIEGDICTVPLPKGHFDLAYVGNGSWHLLTGADRRVAALKSIRQSLRAGAHLALDLFKPLTADGGSEPGMAVLKRSMVARHVGLQRTQTDEEISLNDTEKNHSLILQLLTPEEITTELLKAGFKGVALFGDYLLTPYHPKTSERLLVVASG